jgi:hypothetical protein
MIFWYLFQVVIKATLLRSREEQLVLQDLLNKYSFRYLASQQASFSILFIVAKMAFRNCFRPTYIKEDGNLGTITSLVFDSNYEKNNRDRYLSYLSIGPYAYLSRNHCYFPVPWNKRISIAIQLCLLLPILILLALFRSNRGNLSLLSIELVEASLLLSQIEKMPGLKKVYLFSAFEKDCNFLSYILQRKMKLKVQVVPSSNPLKNFYKQGLCTTLTFTAAFHPAEFEELKANWFYDNTENWPPFGYEEVLPKLNTYKEPTPFTIGLFSSGNWLREQLGHIPTVPFMREAEQLLVQHLKRFLEEKPEFKLVIYLHPLEKRGEQRLAESIRYYRSNIGEQVRFAPFEMNSVSSFDLVDIGVAIYSSTIFQRLFAGQKSLLAPYDMEANYFTDIRLEAISIRSYEQLKTLLLKTANQSPTQYFDSFKLHDYTWKSYSTQLNADFKTA